MSAELFNMGPSLVVPNPTNCSYSNIEGSRDKIPCFPHQSPSTNITDHIFCENSTAVFVPFVIGGVPTNPPSFFSTISTVVPLGSYKEMGDSYTSWVITFVKDTKIFWDLTFAQFPTQYVGTYLSPVVCEKVSVGTYWGSIQFCPNPTTSQLRTMGLNGSVFVHSSPKPVLDWNFCIFLMHPQPVTFTRTKLSHSLFNTLFPSLKTLSTDLARHPFGGRISHKYGLIVLNSVNASYFTVFNDGNKDNVVRNSSE